MIKHTFKILLGVILVIIGLIGGLIPIFQGWMFGIPGVIILSSYFSPAKRLLNWVKTNKTKHTLRPKPTKDQKNNKNRTDNDKETLIQKIYFNSKE